MGKRFVVVGGATAVAGLVLGASIVFGPPATRTEGPGVEGEFKPHEIGSPTSNPDNIPITIEGIDYKTIEVDPKDGQVRGIRLRATRSNLKSQGITELIKPHAEIRLGTQRAITITADKADMEMVDGKPRSGQFTGNVAVTLAQAPVGTELILEQPESKDAPKLDDDEPPAYEQFVQQRIFLDDATDFSIEDDTISTQGPVHVTSKQVDFFGIGLELAYNTQRQRIEQLVIDEGRYLIVNPDAEAPSFNDDTADDNADAEQDEASGNETQAPAPKQFYAATFKDNVLVRDGLESELAGQTLTIDFSLGTDQVQVTPITPDAAGQLPYFLSVGQLAQADRADTPLPALVIPQKNLGRTLLTHDPERDIVVTWTGTLSVSPYAARPEPLADEDDAHLTLTGPNAYVQTIKNGETERLETNKLQYLLSKEQITAYAHDDRPLRILSDALGGEITGQQLTVRQAEGTATILGPGQLTYLSDDDGKTLNLTWQDRLDLELYVINADTDPTPTLSDSEASGKERQQTKILGVKTATFAGNVTAKHTDFDLDADKLTLAFAKPDKQNGIDNTPTAINASGSVAVKARGDAEDEAFDITAGRLSIDLALDQGNEPYAKAIRAVDDVKVTRPGSELTCNRVSVELIPPELISKSSTPTLSDSEASGTEAEKPYAQVRTILAVGQVNAKLTDEDGRRIDLLADQLIADVESDKLTLAAETADNPAEITDLTSGRKIAGELIEMDDQAKQLNITGKGSLATVLDDPNNENAGIEDAFLAIQWTESMAFDNATGQAVFVGGVRSESRRSIDQSEMTCDHLVMIFSPETEDNDKDEKDKDENELDRQIRSAIATGSVRFLASNWDLDKPKQISNRVLLQGPKVIITNQPAADGIEANETLIVEGQGQLMLEDYRPPDEKDADNKAALTGRGMTLFNWDQSMTLDAQTNTATLVGTVQMTHIPKDEEGKQGEPVQLDCEELVADLTDTGGMAGWLADNADKDEQAPDAQVQSITASQKVRLLQQGTRSIRGDKMVFNAEENRVTFTAEGERDVILEDLKRDTQTRTNKVTWDLTKDRIEIDQLRGGVAPLN